MASSSLSSLAYLVSVWIHLIAATVWAGGMAFVVLVVMPHFRGGDRAQAAALFGALGKRFSRVGWACLLLLAMTGLFNAYHRGVRLDDLVRPDFVSSPFGKALLFKLGLFLTVTVLSAYHDFAIGPRATEVLRQAPDSADASRLRRVASYVGRANALLALALYAVAVVLVRGCVV
jgi:copper resistance protein D